MVELINDMNGYIDPAANIQAFYDEVWNIATAQGYGLDVWGRIVDVKRVLTVTGFGNYALSDQSYRTLILAKALANICDGSIGAINQILMNLFPNMGDCYCTDGQDMTMTLVFGFTPTPVQAAIISLSGVIPKPAGVLINTTGGVGGTLAVTIQSSIAAGATQSAPISAWKFGANHATVTGGSGSYAFAWIFTPSDSNGSWTLAGAGSADASPAVTGVAPTLSSAGTLRCTVTDTITGASVASASVVYAFADTAAAAGPPAPGALAVTILPGLSITVLGGAFIFLPNSATITGGVAPFTIQWGELDDGGGDWLITSGATLTAVLSVKLNHEGEDPTGLPTSSQATLTATVRDSAGHVATSNVATYVYTNAIFSGGAEGISASGPS